MVKEYYIRITDQKPSDLEKGVYFKHKGTGDDEEFYILGKNDLSQLRADFEQFQGEVQDNVDPYVMDALSRFPAEKANNAFAITDSADLTKKLSYNDIVNALQGKASSSHNHPTSEVISTQYLDTINSSFGGVEESQQSINKKINDLLKELKNFKESIQWKSVATGWSTSNVTFYVNEPLRLAEFKFSISLHNAVANKVYALTNDDIGQIPSSYRPSNDRFTGGVKVTTGSDPYGFGICGARTNGKVYLIVNRSWSNDSKTVQGSMMWHY